MTQPIGIGIRLRMISNTTVSWRNDLTLNLMVNNLLGCISFQVFALWCSEQNIYICDILWQTFAGIAVPTRVWILPKSQNCFHQFCIFFVVCIRNQAFKCITYSVYKLYANIVPNIVPLHPLTHTSEGGLHNFFSTGCNWPEAHRRPCSQTHTQRPSLAAEPDPHMIKSPEYLFSQLGNVTKTPQRKNTQPYMAKLQPYMSYNKVNAHG